MKVYDVLKEYKALLDEGIITEEEFEKKKKELLALPDFGEEEETQGKIEDERNALEEHRRKLKEASLEEKRKHLEQLEEEERQRNAEREQEEKPVDAEWEPAEESDYFCGETGEGRKKKTKLLGIIIAAIIIVLLILIIVVKTGKPNYEWPKSGLATSIPEPSQKKGEIYSNDNTMFDINLYRVSEDDYSAYVQECMDSGYTVEADDETADYGAYNEDKDRYIEINYYDYNSEMSVTVHAPDKWTDIYWPSSKVVKNLPKPKNLYGAINWDYSDSFSVDIANVSEAEFQDYIDECMKAGYNVDYDRNDDSYYADNKAGVNLSVSYEYFDVMNISVRMED